MFVFLFFPSFPSLGTGWFQSFGPCGSATVSVNLSLGLGVSVRSDSGSSPLDPPPSQRAGTLYRARPEPILSFNSPCHDVILLWAYIIVEMALIKKKYFFKNVIKFFFSPHFQCPPQMTVPLAFAYTAMPRAGSALLVHPGNSLCRQEVWLLLGFGPSVQYLLS